MKWQILSLATFVCFGLASVIGPRAIPMQGKASTFLIYNGIALAMSVGVAWFLVHVQKEPMTFSAKGVLLTTIAGLCGSLGLLCQLFAIAKWPQHTPFIVIIGSLYPAMAIAIALLAGQKFSWNEWMGMFLAIGAIILINLPKKSENTEPAVSVSIPSMSQVRDPS